MYVFTKNNWLNIFIITEFYCNEKNLIIEVDWSIHDLEEVVELDLEKEKLVNNLWIKVIRIKNQDIKNNLTIVINKIKANL